MVNDVFSYTGKFRALQWYRQKIWIATTAEFEYYELSYANNRLLQVLVQVHFRCRLSVIFFS